MTYSLAPIPTTYRGCRFRSRLEARWAVAFDHLGVGWLYEPEGFDILGRWYLPDFLLECGTWIEVKPFDGALDKPLMCDAALLLPRVPPTREAGPRLMILGQPPLPGEADGDVGWLGLDPLPGDEECGPELAGELMFGSYGFTGFHKNRRPWWLGWGPDQRDEKSPWTQPIVDEYEWGHRAQAAYDAANGARFEHGEIGHGR